MRLRLAAPIAFALLCGCARAPPLSAAPPPASTPEPRLEPRSLDLSDRASPPPVDTRLDPVELVPADAILVAGLDLRSLTSTPAWAQARLVFGASAFFRLFDMSGRCGIPIEQLESMHAAMFPGASSEALVIVRGRAIADPAAVECIIGEVQRERRSDGVPELPPPRHELLEGRDVYHFDDRGTRLHVLPAEDILAIVPASADAAFVARLRGGGSSAAHGDLALPIARGRAGQHTMWFVARPPAGASPIERIVETSGNLEVSSGMRLRVDLVYASARDADAALTELRDLVQGLRSVVSIMAIPVDVIDRLRIDHVDTRVEIEASMTGDELSAWWSASQRASTPDADPTSASPPLDSPLL